MPELGWREAIVTVLKSTDKAMHYTEIAQAITDAALRTDVGATPAKSVAATISISMQNDGDDSPFAKVSRGYYALKQKAEPVSGVAPQDTVDEPEDEAGLINAFGMYWQRDFVLWTPNPRLFGQQQSSSEPVDFANQKGVYMLHDGSKVVYAGRTTDQALGTRLRQHTTDRLNGRWNRFSWFGVFPVTEDGALSNNPPTAFSLEALIATMEALLIEGLEPPQNRKRGDDFSAVEFLQVKDPEIQKNETLALIEKLKSTL